MSLRETYHPGPSPIAVQVDSPVVDLENPSNHVLYVKNVAFATTDDTFRSKFEAVVPSLKSAKVARKQNRLSLGFGFVEFVSRDDAVKAIKVLQNVEVD